MNIFDGVQIDDSTKKVLSEKVTELETSYKTQVEKLSSQFEEAVTTRQKAKDKVKELEGQIAAGNGQSKELLESKTKEIETLQSQIEQVKAEADTYKKQYLDFETATRTELLKDLPDGELKKIGEKLSLTDLRTYVSELKKQDTKKDGSFSFSKFNSQPSKNLNEWRQKVNS